MGAGSSLSRPRNEEGMDDPRAVRTESLTVLLDKINRREIDSDAAGKWNNTLLALYNFVSRRLLACLSLLLSFSPSLNLICSYDSSTAHPLTYRPRANRIQPLQPSLERQGALQHLQQGRGDRVQSQVCYPSVWPGAHPGG